MPRAAVVQLQPASGPPSKPPATRKRKRRELPKYLTSEEKDRLFKTIDAAGAVRDRAIFRVAFHHGLRATEVGILELADYHKGNSLDTDRLQIRRLKGSIGGEVHLVNVAAQALRAWLRIRGDKHGPLFLSRNQRAISRFRLDQLMKHYCREAGIPREKAHFHTLKHTCATLLLSEMHESVVDVQHQLGHADIRNTMLYAKLTDPANEARVKRLRAWK